MTDSNQYEVLLADVLANGVEKGDRTGTGTRSVFGRQIRFDLSGGVLPMVTTKHVAWKAMALELFWMLSGNTNVRWLQERGVKIWNSWADENGDLGPVYGAQWRSWNAPDGTQIDQISKVVDSIKADPNSRRHIVNAWNPAELDAMALTPCHAMFQFYVANGKLSCMLNQRSADMFLGVPFNIASYALLTHLIAHHVGLEPGEFIWTGGDTHIYSDHEDQVKEQLSREPYPYPTVKINAQHESIFDYSFEDLELVDYQHHPTIKGAVSV